MAKSKLINVHDKDTTMLFLITKFEPAEAATLLSQGWKFSPELTVVTDIGAQAKSAISNFSHPKYDIEKRSGILDYNYTTRVFVGLVKNMNFDELPDEIDVRKVMR